MSEYIKKKDVSKIVNDYIDGSFRWGAMAVKIGRLQTYTFPDSVENKGEWIPVSERLPEVGQRVIVTVDTFDDGLVVSETVYTKHGFLCGNGIAWQPLPKPYEI